MRSLRGQLWIAVLGYGLEKLIALGVVTLLIHHVAKVTMGKFFVAISVCSVAALVVEFGSARYLVRATAQNVGGAAAWLGGVLTFRLPLLGLALLTINAVVAVTAPSLLWIYVFTSIYVLLENLYYAFGATLTGLGAIGARVATGLVGPLCLLVLVAPAMLLGWSFDRIVVMFAVASTLMAGVGLLVVVKRVGWPPIFRGAVPMRGIIAECQWLFAVNVAVLIHAHLDQWMLASMRNYREVAGYAAAYKLAEVSRSAIRPITMVLFPHFSAAVSNAAWEQVRTHGTRALGAAALISLFVAIAVYAAAPWIVPLLFGRQYPESIAITRVLFVGTPALFVGFVATAIGMSMHLEKQLLAFAGASIALNFVLNLAAIPRWGPLGAAWTTLVSESFFCVSVVASLASNLHLRASRAHAEQVAKSLEETALGVRSVHDG